MKHRPTVLLSSLVALIAGAALISGCGSSDDATSTTSAAAAGTTTAAAHDATTTVASDHKKKLLAPMQQVSLTAKDSQFGKVIFNQDGQVAYAFENDTANTSNCSGECADFWPPVLTTDAPTAAAGLDAAKVGTLTRPDGAKQVTYNGWPLYYMDEPAGEIHCQNMDMHGGLWWVVDDAGNPVKTA